MTQFGTKLHVFKASRQDMSEVDPELTFEHMAINQNAGIRTELVADNNLMIEIDRACEDERPATDDTLAALHLLEWTQFLRECQRRGLRYGFTTYLAFHEMPAQLATLRAARLQRFSDKFGLDWQGETSAEALDGLGRTNMTYDGLDNIGQILMGLSYGALLLVLVINKYGSDFSPIGKFRRYLAEYDRLLGIMSVKEIAIARYVFATQRECPGELDLLRSRIEKNFARKDGKRPKDVADMCATALNGAFDLRLMMVMNIADTRGVEGTRVDCWLATMDGKLKDYNDLCHSVSMGTGEAGLFTAVAKHDDVSDYWKQTGALLKRFTDKAMHRVMQHEQRVAMGFDGSAEVKRKLEDIPRRARAVVALAEEGF